jgi:hypothetical protein
VPISRVQFALVELERRLGRNETCRRIGVADSFLLRLKDQRNIQRVTAEKILIALREVRQEGIVRHRDSIRHGAYLRGRTEKVPTGYSDFYSFASDADNERKRQSRTVAA